MRGRYYRRSDKQRISEQFAANPVPGMSELVPDDNIAPPSFQPMIRHSDDSGVRELLLMR
jgi:putative SOS response-associated peptidase YedK